MYNNSGIIYRIVACGSILLILGVLCLLLSRFWNPTKRNKADLVIAIVIIVIAVSYNVKYLYRLNNLQVKSHEGYFVSDNRTSRVAPPLPFTHEYTFSDASDGGLCFYLDTFSKKEIFPKEFSENIKYRIFYDADTKIIVKVEIIKE